MPEDSQAPDKQASTAGSATGQGGDDREIAPLPGGPLFALAFIAGVFGGLGSIAFKAVIAFVHGLFFYGTVGLGYDPDAHMVPSPLGALVILVPVAGAVLVTWITRTLAPEARGRGVAEVLNAIYYHGGRIPPMVMLAKALASAISIGTGGSVGREGPIIQIGAAFGSTLGQIVRMPSRQRVVLVSAGAAAGIAATFNAPIGGLAFAMELLLVSISARSVALVAVATVTATYIGRLYSGLAPSFDVPRIAEFADHLVSLYTLLLCVPFGVVLGLASALLIRGLGWLEIGFERYIHNDYLRHMTGMLAVGVLMYVLLLSVDHYYVAGVGYATVLDVLRGVLEDPALLLLLFVAKLLATGLTLGSGASGGVFAPSLFLGATLGGAAGHLLDGLVPGLEVEPVVFAVVGMAGMVSGTTGAVLTAIAMTLEQTRDYSAMLPIITAVAIAYVVRVRLVSESIYTLKLARRGAAVPQGLQAALSAAHNARTIMSSDYEVVDISELPAWAAEYQPGQGPRHTVVKDGDTLIGLARPELVYLLRDSRAEAIVDRHVFFVAPRTPWPVIMRGLRTKDTDTALVTSNRRSRRANDIVGVITAREVAHTARDSAELMD